MFCKIIQDIKMSIAEYRAWNKIIRQLERYASGRDMELFGPRTCSLCLFYEHCWECPLTGSKYCTEYYHKLENAAEKGQQGIFINYSQLALDELHQIRSRKERS